MLSHLQHFPLQCLRTRDFDGRQKRLYDAVSDWVDWVKEHPVCEDFHSHKHTRTHTFSLTVGQATSRNLLSSSGSISKRSPTSP